MFDTIRRLYDKDHRKAWEDALSALDIFRGSRLRVIATTPEKVMETPELPDIWRKPGEQQELAAQVLFSDEQDVPRVVIDFYWGHIVSISYLVGEQTVAGGFNQLAKCNECSQQHLASVESFISTYAEFTAKYLAMQVRKMEGKLGRRLG